MTLVPPQCAASGYSYLRAIVINHDQVPNTDQTNFPFLFNTTDPAFATTANGGHIANPNGYDIIFTSDPAGQNQLPYEMEEYNPATGQVIAWVQIPDLSHTTDTTIYMFYGNSNITASQQNPSGVWDSHYLEVLHMNGDTGIEVPDSTENGNNGTKESATSPAAATTGAIANSDSFDGTTSFVALSPPMTAGLSAFSASLWVQTADTVSNGTYWNQSSFFGDSTNGGASGDFGVTESGGDLGMWSGLNSGGDNSLLTSDIVSDGKWHRLDAVNNGTTISLYLDGFNTGQSLTSGQGLDTYGWYLGAQHYQGGAANFYVQGNLEEFHFSNIARSGDWIATEYANQSSPSTFYEVYPENLVGVVPSAAALFASQSEQFTFVNGCAAEAVAWSMPEGSAGALTTGGLYTAPSSVGTQQSITITASSQANGSTVGTATVSLLPAITVSVAPTSTTLMSGQTQQFTANVTNSSNTAVNWSASFGPDGGSLGTTGLFTAPTTVNQIQTVTITATSQVDPAVSASVTLTLLPTVTLTINPSTAVLAVNQTQQLTATLTAPNDDCSGSNCASWSISPAGLGSIDASGLYSAPASIAPGQTVAVTATTEADGVTATATATITLIPTTPTIAVQPVTVTLTGGQSQQYYAAVANLSSTAVTWTMSPAGTGTLSASGLYTAPPVIASQQTITITATSEVQPSLTTSAELTLQPSQCAAQSYGYERSIVIDHTKIPSSDQPDFPFYFAVTDPLLASTSNGGHMASSNGYDIEFSSDPSGQQILSYELEQYNPATGQIVAWVHVPNLSHESDTVIYMFYGDPAIAAPQQNPNGVWDTNYTAVYQLDGVQTGPGSVPDSTSNGNEAWSLNVLPGPGIPGGAGSFDGATSFIELPSNDFASFPSSGTSDANFNASIAVWFKTSSAGVILGQTAPGSPGDENLYYSAAWVPALYIDTNGYLRAKFFNLQNAPQIVSPTILNDDNWHNAVLTFGTSAAENATGSLGTLYVDGQVIGSVSGTFPDAFSSGYSYYLGTGYVGPWFENWPATNSGSTGWFYFNGSLDEVEISSIARSSDWVQAEYNNQSSPSTFFALSPEAGSGGSLTPLAVTLYQSQSQQFTLLETGMCNAGDAVFSMPDGSSGTLSSTGLYIAPASVESQQTVSITATTLGANSSQLSATITLMPPVSVTVTPGVAMLPAGGTQQFAAAVANANNTGVTWSLDPAGVGSISASGLYTAPATVSGQPTVSVIASSQADPMQSASAKITLGVAAPPVSAVTISPTAVTLTSGQVQQFTASVTNESSTAVTWSITPAGVGTISTNGLYNGPASITSQQTVTITATSQADPTQSASAMVTLSPNTCDSAAYGYQRVIVIDHTKVADTDQINYPFLFNSTDPDLATVDNGGHVANPNGYDIIFSTDPNGQTRLDFEIEEYNPATGQLVAWIRIPNLSHSSDTVIYVFYGNPAITTSQANPTGVWDSNYEAVYHLGNLPSTEVASDSTSNANNGSFTNFTAIPGQIDGSAGLDGVTSYLQIPATAFLNYPTTTDTSTFNATFGVWFKTTSWGGLLDQTSSETCYFFTCSPEEPGDVPAGSWSSMLDVNFDGFLEGAGVGPSTQVYNDNNWHYAVLTFNNGINSLYADGQLIATGQGNAYAYDSAYSYFVGSGDIETDTSSLDAQPWKYLPGQIDEINVSDIARSSDWIQTQFNNQSSPSTFYTLYSPNAVQVAPSSVSLYASQSEQFTVPGTCDATISWSIPAGSLGTLTSTGLYTAPSVVSSQQIVTVSAMSQSNGSSFGSAQVTLLPVPQPLTLVASTQSPYQVGSSQSFTATLLDPQGNPQVGLTVNFSVAGVNATVGSATTSSSGTATFSYTGSNSGTDTVVATASVDGVLISSNSLSAAWITPPPAQAPAITLLPQPSPGRGALIGAFTDNNGDLIEPIVVGTAARTFITPTGATRLQLGINDDYYEDNGGAGFVVAVNGSNISVPPTAMPWNWQTGGLNNNYQYGINDGTNPILAAASLTAGQAVTVAYQGGTVSTDFGIRSPVDANGETDFITGTQLYEGAYFPTLYTTGTAYPQNQPINVFAVVTDATGAPIPNAPVTLTISGANPGQYQATSDATGIGIVPLHRSVRRQRQPASAGSRQRPGHAHLEPNNHRLDQLPDAASVGSLSLNPLTAA